MSFEFLQVAKRWGLCMPDIEEIESNTYLSKVHVNTYLWTSDLEQTLSYIICHVVPDTRYYAVKYSHQNGVA